tara:strand:- start:197 stop:616 length:420 start_codon:yes stop_codon:yes gene_type:complete
MARIAKADVNAALARVAQHINNAAGGDKITSRADMKAKLETLEGTEKQLADIFFRFIDHRDHKFGARVTSKDVEKALTYAQDRMIEKYDINTNGLSKSEIDQMSRTGQLAVQLSQELKLADNNKVVAQGDSVSQKAMTE